MDNKHLDDFIALYDAGVVAKVGDVISEYTAKAIGFSNDGFSPDSFDYDLAYRFIMDKYDVGGDLK